MVPFTLLTIFVLLHLTLRRFEKAPLIMATLSFAMIGGIWLPPGYLIADTPGAEWSS